MIPDLDAWMRAARAADKEGAGSASNVIRPVQPSRFHNMSDAMLADEHRGHSFAKRRAEEALKAIEAELTARGKTVYVGTLGRVEKKDTIGLVDLKRLRAERPDIVAQFAQPGTRDLWSSATRPAHERANERA